MNVLFSYEEALGYCIGDLVTDKDGLSAACVMVEIANQLALENSTLYEHFQYLQQLYGIFVSYNGYIIIHDTKITNTIFERIRTGGPNHHYFTHGFGIKIISIKDVTLGYDSTKQDFKCDLPVTPDSHMIMFEFENNITCTFRTSGTEPKLKYYTEIAGQSGQTEVELTLLLHTFIDKLIEEFLQPSLYGLKKI